MGYSLPFSMQVCLAKYKGSMNLRGKITPLIHGAMQTLPGEVNEQCRLCQQNSNLHFLKKKLSTTFISKVFRTIMTTLGNKIIFWDCTFKAAFVNSEKTVIHLMSSLCRRGHRGDGGQG